MIPNDFRFLWPATITVLAQGSAGLGAVPRPQSWHTPRAPERRRLYLAAPAPPSARTAQSRFFGAGDILHANPKSANMPT